MGEIERHERRMAELQREKSDAYAENDNLKLMSVNRAINFEYMRHAYRLKAIREVNPAPGFKYNHC